MFSLKENLFKETTGHVQKQSQGATDENKSKTGHWRGTECKGLGIHVRDREDKQTPKTPRLIVENKV